MHELQQRFAEVEEAVRLKEERGEEGEKEHLKVIAFLPTLISVVTSMVFRWQSWLGRMRSCVRR